MILYHFTRPENVPHIAAHGLKPGKSENTLFMTDGLPVVWLTRQEDNRQTPEDTAFLKLSGAPVNENRLLFGGRARLSVRVDLNNKSFFATLTFAANKSFRASRSAERSYGLVCVFGDHRVRTN